MTNNSLQKLAVPDGPRPVLGLEEAPLKIACDLSPFEWQVLTEYRTGKSYKEMATALGCKIKSIDNALSRIRRKLPKVAPEQAARLGRG